MPSLVHPTTNKLIVEKAAQALFCFHANESKTALNTVSRFATITNDLLTKPETIAELRKWNNVKDGPARDVPKTVFSHSLINHASFRSLPDKQSALVIRELQLAPYTTKYVFTIFVFQP